MGNNGREILNLNGTDWMVQGFDRILQCRADKRYARLEDRDTIAKKRRDSDDLS